MKEIEQEMKHDYATNDEHCNKNIRLGGFHPFIGHEDP
jgi:hypothetical protein